MLLRRITEHVKAQNWFAVGLDFLIVVVGVFVGLQVSNWNESRSDANLERTYLVRLANDMRSTTTKLSIAADEYEDRRSTSAVMVKAASDPSISDAALIEATSLFLTDGWHTPYFQPVDSAYQDLSSTGNLQLIRNTELRDAVIALYENYDDVAASFKINQDWVLPNDSRIMYEHDLLQMDARFDGVYVERHGAEKNEAHRSIQAELGRVAAGYHWIFDISIREIRKATDETNTVLEKIEAELEGR